MVYRICLPESWQRDRSKWFPWFRGASGVKSGSAIIWSCGQGLKITSDSRHTSVVLRQTFASCSCHLQSTTKLSGIRAVVGALKVTATTFIIERMDARMCVSNVTITPVVHHAYYGKSVSEQHATASGQYHPIAFREWKQLDYTHRW